MMRPVMRIAVTALCAAVFAWPAAGALAETCPSWLAWEGFRSRFVNDGGRVIDPSTPSGQTTSEGQAYGLFFALVAGDRRGFDRILHWTEDNLAGGDLTARLPAWQWGKRNDGSWGVIDSNPASDADLWIAYTLGEAGSLWKEPKYAAMGRLIAERALREETTDIPGLGRTLLPGPSGFQPKPGLYRLNPSYMPIQLMRRFASLYPQKEWKQLVTTSIDTLVRSAPLGFAPDWILFKANGGFQPDTDSKAMGGFNAIRTYLWSGMLAENDPARKVLLKTYAPAARYVVQNGVPPLAVDTRTGKTDGAGPTGFSAAVAPLLTAMNMREAAQQQRLRIDAKAPLSRDDNYYEQVLVLFDIGWKNGRYRFARDGALQVPSQCAAH
jgi:endoglucanase